MDELSAAQVFHDFVLEKHPSTGLSASIFGSFLDANPVAGRIVRQKGLKKFCQANARLLIWSDYPNPGLVTCAQNAGAAAGFSANKVERAVKTFYDQVLKDNGVLRKACEDREKFSAELRAWKEAERQHGFAHRLNPTLALYTMKKLNLISVYQDGVIVWTQDGAGSRESRKQRLSEAASRVRYSREELSQNRHGIAVSAITIGLRPDGELKTVRVGERQREVLTVSNTNAYPVLVSIDATLAKGKGVVFDNPGQVVLAASKDITFNLSYTPMSVGVLRCVVMVMVQRLGFAGDFSIARYITVRAGDEEMEEILKPTSPYKQKARKARDDFEGPSEKAEKPRSSMPAFVRTLAEHKVPPQWRQAVIDNTAEEELIELLMIRDSSRAEAASLATECAVCFEAIENSTAVRLPCKHIFHASCIRGMAAAGGGAAMLCPLCRAPVPPTLEVVDPASLVLEQAGLDRPELRSLSMRNYCKIFHRLLWAEEIQMGIDIRNYDIEKTSLPRRGLSYDLHVPGLAESRPSVLRGDTVLVRFSGERELWEGYVERIELERAVLRFSRRFSDLYVDGMRVDVRFQVKRMPLKLAHQAVETTAVEKPAPPHAALSPQLLFPSPLGGANNPPKPPLVAGVAHFFNRDLNAEQQAAVVGALRAVGRPAPYIIYGPPGTGKTVTLVEAILQAVKVAREWRAGGGPGGPGGEAPRLLICAPSNSAVDLVVQRLAAHVSPREMLRLPAYSRELDDIPAGVRPYCRFDAEERAFVVPPPDDVKRYLVVAVTITSGGKFPNLGLAGHFSHVFMDEAGHAIEPEAISTFAELTRKPDPVIVLAGDPQQLGPVVRSELAKQFGLSKSLLERLSERPCYARAGGARRGATPTATAAAAPNQGPAAAAAAHQPAGPVVGAVAPYDGRLVTKLVRNYRSHEAILRLPNELFYDGDLAPCADRIRSHNLVDWEHLPARARGHFPLIFHGVHGVDDREGNSPSWFNTQECTVVAQYVDQLVKETRRNRCSPEDIGVVTPYHKQAQKLRLALRVKGYEGCKVGSVDEFQGSERRVIIISTVRSTVDFIEFDLKYQLGFVSNPKRFNVAVTRAQALLIVVGNPLVLERDKHWNALLQYCVSQGGYVGCPYTATSASAGGGGGRASGAADEGALAALDSALARMNLDGDDQGHHAGHGAAQDGPWRTEE